MFGPKSRKPNYLNLHLNRTNPIPTATQNSQFSTSSHPSTPRKLLPTVILVQTETNICAWDAPRQSILTSHHTQDLEKNLPNSSKLSLNILLTQKPP